MMLFLKFVCCDFSCLVLFHSTCPFLSQQHISFLNNLFFYILFRNFFFPPITDHCLMLNLLSKSFRYQFAERQPFVNAEYQLNRTEHATSQRIDLHASCSTLDHLNDLARAYLICYVYVALGQYCHCVLSCFLMGKPSSLSNDLYSD